MKKITYQAALKDLVHLVPTETYNNSELTENLMENGVTEPIVFTTDGAKSRFGMKKLNVKDGMKRLNLAATNQAIGELTAQVVLIEDSLPELIPFEKSSPMMKVTDANVYQKTYSWINEKRNISECCTAIELGSKYGIRLQYLNTVIQGKVKCSRGWSLAQS
ncbi:MAG: hypothetical protein AAFQ80_16120 [Cyanobacteria bacterium J06621_8]